MDDGERLAREDIAQRKFAIVEDCLRVLAEVVGFRDDFFVSYLENREYGIAYHELGEFVTEKGVVLTRNQDQMRLSVQRSLFDRHDDERQGFRRSAQAAHGAGMHLLAECLESRLPVGGRMTDVAALNHVTRHWDRTWPATKM